jgi:hypothetical protein
LALQHAQDDVAAATETAKIGRVPHSVQVELEELREENGILNEALCVPRCTRVGLPPMHVVDALPGSMQMQSRRIRA